MKPTQLLFLRVLTCCVFLGRAWQHWFWDVPLRALLWDEQIMSKPVQAILGMDWATYISSMRVNAWIEGIASGVGVFYLVGAVAAIFVNAQRKWLGRILVVGALGLLLLAGLYWLEKFMSIGQLIEYSLQIGTPLFLYWAIFTPSVRLLLVMKVAIVLTFVGHGLYALGYYPVPAHFVQMMIDGFGVSESWALAFLKIVGILDVFVAISLFLPILKNPTLIYCIVWGTMTASARVISNFDINIPVQSLHEWLYEVLIRLAHGGIPLFSILDRKKQEHKTKALKPLQF